MRRFLELAGVLAFLTLAAAAAVRYSLARGYTLYDGDAEAHLNIARRILDSRTPGPEQIGTVWLPLPHILMIPAVMHGGWWQSGAAGAVVSPVALVLAGAFLFAAARRVYLSAAAAFAAVLIFALNPNVLYLGSTAMTELPFAACSAALLWSTVWFRDSQSIFAILFAGIAAFAASLTRYEGWFFIPFVAIYFLFIARRKWHAVLFGAIALLGPLAWLAHNRYYYGDALEFYHGPWSALAIYQRQRAAGRSPYPGDHDWRKACQYYFAAARLVCGPIAIVLGAAGAILALLRKAAWPLLFLSLAPIFFVLSMHSSGTPIFVPGLWPYSFYNTRYALAVVMLAAFAAGAIVTLLEAPRPRSPAAIGSAPVLDFAPAGLPGGSRAQLPGPARVDPAGRRISPNELSPRLGNPFFLRRSDRSFAPGRHPAARGPSLGKWTRLERSPHPARSVPARGMGAGLCRRRGGGRRAARSLPIAETDRDNGSRHRNLPAP